MRLLRRLETDFVGALERSVERSAARIAGELGPGFGPKVYLRALELELDQAGLRAELNPPFAVRYLGCSVGTCESDLLVEGALLVEVEAAGHLDRLRRARCESRLRAAGLGRALLLDFGGRRLGVARVAA
jgi:GxxExxY protein